jgi:uncharacterized membrane protein
VVRPKVAVGRGFDRPTTGPHSHPLTRLMRRVVPAVYFPCRIPPRMPSSDAAKSRLAYIDWMRGLACVLMFQTHCYDSWLSPAARRSSFCMYSQLGGTFPAPLFLFLAGISFVLVTEKLRQKSVPAGEIARTTIRRGAEILGLGLLFRLQEFVLGWGWSPASDLLRVDILNTIGLSMMLMGVICWIVIVMQRGRTQLAVILTAIGVALLISLLTPLVWTVWRPRFLPWPLESYIDGVHNLGTPQSWLFPIFPWTGFAFAGLAVGFILQSPWSRAREAKVFFSVGAAGIVLIVLSRWLDAQPRQIYPVYDYWRTSPEFFLIRLGMLMVILTASYAWCRWGAAQLGFSPLIQLGQASLLVYWVHIEFVYGRLSILHKHGVGIPVASVGLLVIFLAMVWLAYIRTRTKGRFRGYALRGISGFAKLRTNSTTSRSAQRPSSPGFPLRSLRNAQCPPSAGST